MSKWDVKENGAGYEWSLKRRKSEEIIEDYEYESNRSDVAYMVFVLGTVVTINCLISCALFMGVMYAMAVKIYPMVDRVALGAELRVLGAYAVVWMLVLQMGLIKIHAFLGKMIAKHD